VPGRERPPQRRQKRGRGLWRLRPSKAGVAPDLATTPRAATERSEILANTHSANGLTNTGGEGRGEVYAEGSLHGYLLQTVAEQPRFCATDLA
jgi:hypothetical protein